MRRKLSDALAEVLLFVVVTVGLVLAFVDCMPLAQPPEVVISDSLAGVGNVSAKTLNEIQTAEGSVIIARAETLEQATAGLELLERQWEPIWKWYDVLQDAHENYRQAVNEGKPTAALAGQVFAFYCKLRGAARGHVELPDNRLVPCERTP